jgi:hypothetical protein
MAHWPLYEGDLDAIRREADEWATSNATVPEATSGPVATITKRSADATVKFDWVRGENMYGLVNGIKAIPSADRKYNPETKVWSVKLSRLDEVVEALKVVFDQDHIITVESGEQTPEDLYRPRPRGNNPRRVYYRGGVYWRR